MFDSQLVNLYAVLGVVGIVLVLWVIISKWMQPVTANAHLLSESQENLTGISAFLLAGSSVALSIGFAIVLSFHPILTIVFVSMFAGFALVEFISSFHLSKAWAQRRIGGVFFGIWLMIGGVAISILAGQSLLQIAESNAKAERLKQNADYEAFLTRRENANQRTQELAITDSEVQSAKTALAALLIDRERIQRILDACPSNYITKCIKPNAVKLEGIEANIATHETVMKRGNEYQAARQIADELNAMPIEAVPGTNESSPGIEALALVLRADAKVVGAYVFLALAIFCEFSALIAFYLWGQSRYERVLMMSGSVYEGDAQSVLNDAQSVTKIPPSPVSTSHAQSVISDAQSVTNGLENLFKAVKTDITNGTLDKPSFARLRKTYKATTEQAKKIREMLVNDKVCVKDSTGKLVPVR